MTLFLQFISLETSKQVGFLWKVILYYDRYCDIQKSVEREHFSGIICILMYSDDVSNLSTGKSSSHLGQVYKSLRFGVLPLTF